MKTGTQRIAEWEHRVAGDPRWTKVNNLKYETTLLGDTLVYWPGSMKVEYRGNSRVCDVLLFIEYAEKNYGNKKG